MKETKAEEGEYSVITFLSLSLFSHKAEITMHGGHLS